MATKLFKLGERIYEHKWKALLGGLIVLIMTAAAALGVGAAFTGDIEIPGTKSELAMEVMNEKFPSDESTGNGSVQLVFKAPAGAVLDDETIKAEVEQVLEYLSSDPDLESIISPYDNYSLNATKEIAYATLNYKLPAAEVGEQSIAIIEEAVQLARQAGLQAEYTGNIGSVIPEIGGLSEIVGIVVAYLILALTFGSLLAAGLPIITAVIGLGIGIMLILLSTHVMEVSAISMTLAVMLGLAVGIDYALFIISRHRQSLLEGKSVKQALAIANATAGSSVVFAGLTVIIALLGLAVVRIPFLTTMGIAAAITVAAAIIVAITIVPALLAIAGERIRPKAKLVAKQEKASKKSLVERWGSTIVKYPLPIAIMTIMLLLFCSIPALNMETGLPDNGMKSEELTERRAYDLLAEGYGAGINGPLVIVAVAEKGNDSSQQITEALEQLNELPNIATIHPPYFNEDSSAAIINLLPETGPNDRKTKQLVEEIRLKADDLSAQYGVELMVTGSTAVNIDISSKLTEALPQFAILIVSLAIILLAIVFRSIWIPIKAVLGYLLTLTTTLGFIVFVVQEGHLASWFGIAEPGPILSFLPVLTAGILFGLAMDYEVFLVSRMREEYARTKDARKAVLAGIKNSGGVVVAAGLIMVVVFASFIFVEDGMIKSMGLALAFGIFVDAFIVRMTLVPAIMTMMKRSAWYFPKWLERITPSVDIEGEAIIHEMEKQNSSNHSV